MVRYKPTGAPLAGCSQITETSRLSRLSTGKATAMGTIQWAVSGERPCSALARNR